MRETRKMGTSLPGTFESDSSSSESSSEFCILLLDILKGIELLELTPFTFFLFHSQLTSLSVTNYCGTPVAACPNCPGRGAPDSGRTARHTWATSPEWGPCSQSGNSCRTGSSPVDTVPWQCPISYTYRRSDTGRRTTCCRGPISCLVPPSGCRGTSDSRRSRASTGRRPRSWTATLECHEDRAFRFPDTRRTPRSAWPATEEGQM